MSTNDTLRGLLAELRLKICATPENDKTKMGVWFSTQHPLIERIDAALAEPAVEAAEIEVVGTRYSHVTEAGHTVRLVRLSKKKRDGWGSEDLMTVAQHRRILAGVDTFNKAVELEIAKDQNERMQGLLKDMRRCSESKSIASFLLDIDKALSDPTELAGISKPQDGVSFGFDDRSVMVSQEAYSIFLEREAAIREGVNQQAGSGVPEGFVLVPKQMYLGPEDIHAIAYMCGGDPDSEDESEHWLGGVLWVGECIDDDGSKTYGLNIACQECLEEGSVPVHEFAAPLPPSPAAKADV